MTFCFIGRVEVTFEITPSSGWIIRVTGKYKKSFHDDTIAYLLDLSNVSLGGPPPRRCRACTVQYFLTGITGS